jgi:hypothetical protein
MNQKYLANDSRNYEARIKGFDDYELKLGDIMRGERATLGKSLLDVQRELRIKASYVSAIENCDAEVFETPGFIAGYVRSYAKYLGICPEIAYDKFCAESGYALAHGMSEHASVRKTRLSAKRTKSVTDDGAQSLFLNSATAFLPAQERIFENIESRAVASVAILILLMSGLVYGGWSVLKEIQQVRVIPAEITPITMSQIDPLAGDQQINSEIQSYNNLENIFLSTDLETIGSLDRLYRPKALDMPILKPRVESISSLDPSNYGNFRPVEPILPAKMDLALNKRISVVPESSDKAVELPLNLPKVLEDAPARIALFATRDAWVSIKTADGTRLFQNTMKAGDEFVLPATDIPVTLHAGMSGSIYFAINGELYGPAGTGTQVIKNVSLSQTELQRRYSLADVNEDPQLLRVAATVAVSSFTIDDLSD